MNDDPRQAIREELKNQPVKFDFGHGGKHPYVEIKYTTEQGFERRRRIPFSSTPHSHVLKNVRTDVRRALRQMGVERLGTLGEKIVEATRKEDRAMQPELQKPTASAVPPNGADDPKPVIETSDKKPEKRQSKMTNKEVALVTRIICTYATIDDVRKLVTYHEGWDDERILKLIHAAPDREHVQLHTVIDLRREALGQTPKEAEKPTRAKKGAMSKREELEDARARILLLEDAVEALKGAILGPKAIY